MLVDFEEVTGVDTSGAPSFFNSLLSLPALDLDGVSFWGEFILVNDSPVTLRLLSVDQNQPGVSGVEGKWRITETVDAVDCEEGVSVDTYEVLVLQDGNQLTVGTPVGIFEGFINGNTLDWSGSYPDDGGTTTESFSITFNATIDSLTASSSWSWSGDGESCSGSSSAVGILLHN